ncbi:peptidase C56 [Tersicoccus phoenicis]|uniref:Peptidase C56 n=1 Tax=Tersicoccus phoenicis TaxID=554083 RepID=A0A1R1LPZ3_9MICC|nr:type 1 glutamine amidotransferase domain-containing protein [Tersicoccus phoenicis]OMH29542.1 peptidase C56 [Tersicoccus phoenicis]
MAQTLDGKKIAFLLTDGVEQAELTHPWQAVKDAGGTPVLISPKGDTVQGMNGDTEEGDTFDVDVKLADAKPEDYASLVIPGGVVNADHLRTEKAAVAFAKAFFDAHKPVASICHGPWLLIEAGVVDGRTMTSYPSLQTDLRNAGATWVDETVVVDAGLTTSRNPGDLDAFSAKVVEEAAEGQHPEQHA